MKEEHKSLDLAKAKVKSAKIYRGEINLLTMNFHQPRVLVIHWFQLLFATNPPLGILMM
jgi:hypothetical protein